jgi:hypothetical protein
MVKIKFKALNKVWEVFINNYSNWEFFKNRGYYEPANDYELNLERKLEPWTISKKNAPHVRAIHAIKKIMSALITKLNL